MEVLTYIIVAVIILGLCVLGMSVGLIFRNKTFTSCGRAARDFDGEPIRCAACGEQVDADSPPCDREEEEKKKQEAVSA